MNWTRGLIRLWLLASLAWVGANFDEAGRTVARAQSNCASARHYALNPDPAPAPSAFRRFMEEAYRERGERYQPPAPTSEERIAVAEITCRLDYQYAAKKIAAQMLVPPAALFIGPVVLFFIGAWVVRGFQPTRKQA